MPSYVVSGASRGIGYAFAKHLASIEGNTIIGLVRNQAATEARLRSDGITNVHLVVADITDFKALKAAANEIAQITGGSLDVLINNAALIPERSQWTSLVDHDPEELEGELVSSFKANVVGTAHTINAFLPLIRRGQMKKVITLSTGVADVDLINQFALAYGAPYSISKAATNMLVAKYNAALGKSEGIMFLSISPGMVDTSEGKARSEQGIAGYREMTAKIAQYAPHFTGPITPEESVRMQMAIIDKATVETFGGAFVSHLGNKQWL
ncbi:NAD(P)-binding protein [Teratosphaeria nubilosa]|uniref:NAD(P)-binding protein n=1 Tax=Teratosphaeria nubilosa TaxID=161662 RepID=A0A6G1KTA4_9PEZI|nr:NAD(P)-binding protein [Teratosphaeria nubilosa]